MKKMKSLRIIFLAIMVAIFAIPTLVSAQDANYKHQTSIDSKGKIKKDGVAIGYISKKKEIFDAKGHKIAYMDGQGNMVDAEGKKMGKMGKDGKTFENVNGELVYSVKDDGNTCNIFDVDGKKIGNVHSSYKGMACILYCFQNNMSMETHSKAAVGDKFACPMHPEVTGKDGDKCNKCGMKLTKAEK